MYNWTEFYKEKAKWLLQYRNRQKELIDILKKVGFTTSLMDKSENGNIPLEVMEPFSFFAFFQSLGYEKRMERYNNFVKLVDFPIAAPEDYDGIPSVMAQALRFFNQEKDRGENDIDYFWNLAEDAVNGKLQDKNFENVLNLKYIGIAKLTQGLFWLNPYKFYPIDKHKGYIEREGINTKIENLEDYERILKQVADKFKKPYYQISHEAWQWSRSNDNNDAYSFYIESLKNIVRDLQIEFDDKRVAFTTIKNGYNFIVGQRYCFSLKKRSNNDVIRVISKKSLNKKSDQFDGKPNAYLTDLNNLEDVKKYYQEILSQTKIELNRTTKSGFIKHDNENFRKMIFNTKRYNQHSKNQILFGPPGTGKTYNTVNYAVSIIENKSISEVCDEEKLESGREKLKKRFEEYVNRGQIVFTTFHQSMCYEEFVEGFKPIKAEEQPNNISYEVESGIFKLISAKAAYASYKKNLEEKENQYSFDDLFDAFITNIQSELDDNKPVYFKTISNAEKEVVRVSSNNSVVVKTKNSKSKNVVSITKETLQKIYDKYDRIDEIINLSHFEDLGINTRHTNTFAVFNGLKDFEKQFNKDFVITEEPSSNLEDSEILKKFEGGVFTEAVKKYGNSVENFVLIIDEINRGNVSQILGELITLIEEDKRLGNKESTEVILPYSKSKFSIPPNLYIIGTMNTADRSIEVLDSALRRRFDFIEIPPNYDLIKKTIEGVELSKLLETINLRIEKLLDKDHQIGHSYFIGVDSTEMLKNVFKNKLIPLLQEYFFGDFGKIGLVLGKGFVTGEDSSDTTFAKFDYENADDLIERKIWKIKNIEKMSNEEFRDALKII